ncbi:hypothetical protein [Halorhodospira abdelmalekii]|uniref:hypothetical protein n=1 Tax=Halorhodospira abdelmalekii TaxID=421629 RepID=UPI00190867B6|nr:hypothetical protein [Halorhodospira abdelmalekii]
MTSSERALDIAHNEGVVGATLVPASGISNPPIKTFFGLTFQSAMSIIFWVAEADRADRTARKLRDELGLDSPRQGLAMILPVAALYGLNLQGRGQVPGDHPAESAEK